MTDTEQSSPSLASVAVFTATTFLGASLVFLVQPLVTKRLLPLLGGTPAVWNTSMVFFQAALLLGYGYTHVATTQLRARRQIPFHLLVLMLPAAVLPIALPDGWEPPTSLNPVVWLLFVLLVMVGLPFFAVSTTSPLLQQWFSLIGHRRSHDPYFLYAAGNVGSVLGLLAYPFLIEARLSLDDQARLWAGLYAIFVVGCIICALTVRRRTQNFSAVPESRSQRVSEAVPSREPVAKPTWKQRGLWVLLAAIPSSLTIGVSTQVSVDIASIPLFWVVPLTVYLLTFIVTFSPVAGRWLTPRRADWLFPPAAGLLAGLSVITEPGLRFSIAAHLGVLLLVGLVCHGRLAEQRPATNRLTEFYLCLAIGGVLGGIFNAIVVPLVFSSIVEMALVVVVALLVRPVGWKPQSTAQWALEGTLAIAIVVACVVNAEWLAESNVLANFSIGRAIALGVLGSVILWTRPLLATALIAALFVIGARPADGTIERHRSFFAAVEVVQTDGRNEISNGTTLHGSQWIDEPRRRIATTYYHRAGPVGEVFTRLQGDPRRQKVALVGLGAGTLASYAEAGERFDFFEIDPDVVRTAENKERFTYLADARSRGADISVTIGDARLTLAKSEPKSFGVIVLDAFSSDAIPVHLLTTEAVEMYANRLSDDGVLLIHISNRYLTLEPVVAAVAREAGLVGLVRNQSAITDEQTADGAAESDWIILTRRADVVQQFRVGEWRDLEGRPDIRAWTDEFSNVQSVLTLD